jgi:A/G-specific adenine glycosylase
MSTFTHRHFNKLSASLLTWYRRHARTLPWRNHPDPYAVWVSEIMLQQTRVETVIPYFQSWMERFPSIKDLANASEQDVLNLWEGLGYYSRARNFHKAAKVVLEKYNGQLPRNLDSLRQLPGIGRYTAGAIASMAFGLDEPTLDGNIRRVLARVFDVGVPADSSAGEKVLWNLAAEHLPKGKAGDYNQAIMDLGATICIPKNPQCLICPLMKICAARQKGIQDQRPVLKPKNKTPHYVLAAAVIVKNKRVLLAQRPSRGLLGGMWEFPTVRVDDDPAKELSKTLRGSYPLKVRRKDALKVVHHAYSHFKVTVHPFHCELIAVAKNANLKWVNVKNLEDFPMGKVDRQIAKLLN